jgi:hypothetical protein
MRISAFLARNSMELARGGDAGDGDMSFSEMIFLPQTSLNVSVQHSLQALRAVFVYAWFFTPLRFVEVGEPDIASAPARPNASSTVLQ